MPRRTDISSILIIAVTALSACATAAARWPEDPAAQRSLLDHVASRCGLPPSVFTLHAPGHVALSFHPDTPSRKIDCALGRLNRAQVPPSVLGFFGNERLQD